jgi:hypothetical protein
LEQVRHFDKETEPTEDHHFCFPSQMRTKSEHQANAESPEKLHSIRKNLTISEEDEIIPAHANERRTVHTVTLLRQETTVDTLYSHEASQLAPSSLLGTSPKASIRGSVEDLPLYDNGVGLKSRASDISLVESRYKESESECSGARNNCQQLGTQDGFKNEGHITASTASSLGNTAQTTTKSMLKPENTSDEAIYVSQISVGHSSPTGNGASSIDVPHRLRLANGKQRGGRYFRRRFKDRFIRLWNKLLGM